MLPGSVLGGCSGSHGANTAVVALAGSLLVTAALLPACRGLVGFGCSQDDQCRNGAGTQGLCFSVGACGYPDTMCPSGYRYSDTAPEPWAGACVVAEADPGTSTGTSTSTGMEPGSSSSSDGASESSSSSSSGPNNPVCGDMIVEGDEQCDDGNPIESDGCNPDCRASGVQISSWQSGLAEDDVALAVLRLDDDDVIVAGTIDATGSDNEAYVARHRPDGSLVWSYSRGGNAARDDSANGLALSLEGHVRVAGWVVPNDPDITPRPDIWIAELDVETGIARWDFVDGSAAPSIDRADDLLTLPGGDVVVAGRVGTSAAANFALRRYAVTDTGDGFELSLSWARAFSGAAATSDWAYAVGIDRAGLLVGGALHATATDIDRHLRGLDLDGNPRVPECADNGSEDPLAADDRIFDLAVGLDGTVAAVGWATKADDEGADAWVGLYAPGSCSLQWATTHLGSGHDTDAAWGVAIDDLGRIVVAGYLNVGNGEDAWLAKYAADGTLLWEIEPIDGPGNGADRWSDVVIGEDNEIIVAGQLREPMHNDIWVARYTP